MLGNLVTAIRNMIGLPAYTHEDDGYARLKFDRNNLAWSSVRESDRVGAVSEEIIRRARGER